MTQAWKAGKRPDGIETAPETVLGLKWMSAEFLSERLFDDSSHATMLPMAKMTLKNEQDSPWKEFLERFFEEFMLFFFPKVHADIDWKKKYEFLDKELQRVVRDSKLHTRYADKLVKVFRKSGREQWVLVHIEVQGSREPDFEKRMFTYHYRLFDRYQKPVAGFAVLTDGNEDWRPSRYSSEIWNTRLSFEFNLVKILDHEKTTSGRRKGPMELIIEAHRVARLTRPDSATRLQQKLALVKSLYRGGFVKEEILELFRILDWLMTLSNDLSAQFKIDFDEFEKEVTTMPYVTSVERISMSQGLEKGLQSLRKPVSEQLKAKFGTLKNSITTRIQAADEKTLTRWGKRLLSSETLDDVLAES